jgi:hypothetical protein
VGFNCWVCSGNVTLRCVSSHVVYRVDMNIGPFVTKTVYLFCSNYCQNALIFEYFPDISVAVSGGEFEPIMSPLIDMLLSTVLLPER